MKIGIDVEGTLADPHKLWVEEYNRLYGASFSVDDITNWYLEKTKFGLSIEEFISQVRDIWNKRWEEIPTIESNVSEKIQALNRKYKVMIVTSRKVNENEIKSWLEFNKIKYDDFIAVAYNASSSGKSHLNCDVFIDDNPLLASEVTQKRGRMLLYDRPWNRMVTENQYVKRINNLDQAIEFLNNYKRR